MDVVNRRGTNNGGTTKNKRDVDNNNRESFNSRHTRNITDKQHQQRHQQKTPTTAVRTASTKN
jgi:hypothetical protein